MKIGEWETHPAADAFPMMDEAQLAELAADIRANGLRADIVTFAGAILDGRNRLKACLAAQVKPRFERYQGKDLVGYVISANLHRRHLNESQRALVAARLAKLEPGQRLETGKFAGLTQEQAGAALKVGERSVRHARTVLERAVPELVRQVEAGTMAVSTAADIAVRPVDTQRAVAKQLAGKDVRPGHARAVLRQHERRKTVQKINNAEVRPLAAVTGPFRVILTDNPWPYDNSDGHAGSRGHIPYPPMSIDELCRYGRALEPLIHPEGAILFSWTTNAFVPACVRTVAAWGFDDWRTMLTWTKSKVGVGTWARGRTEHVVIASRGKVPHTLNEISTWLGDRALDVREHSRKPDELYEAIEKHCPGPRLELFARATRPGWAQWGAELGKKFKAAS